MQTTEGDNQLKEKSFWEKHLFLKIYILCSAIVLLTYGKIVWPLIFGRMHKQNITLLEAVKDSTVHSTAFSFLVLAVIIGFVWVCLMPEGKED